MRAHERHDELEGKLTSLYNFNVLQIRKKPRAINHCSVVYAHTMCKLVKSQMFTSLLRFMLFTASPVKIKRVFIFGNSAHRKRSRRRFGAFLVRIHSARSLAPQTAIVRRESRKFFVSFCDIFCTVMKDRLFLWKLSLLYENLELIMALITKASLMPAVWLEFAYECVSRTTTWRERVS